MKATTTTSIRITKKTSRVLGTIGKQTGMSKQAIVDKSVDVYKEHLTAKGLIQ